MSTTATWVSVSIGLPEEILDALEQVNAILEVVSTLLEIVVAIMEIIKIFLLDLTNPLAILLQALLLIVENLINDLRQTGLYMYADLPDRSVNDEFAANLKGGMDGWRGRMSYALLSPNVQNRPNFSTTSTVISFHLVVAVADLGALVSSFGFLLALFKQQTQPDFNPPKNLSVRPINEEFYNTYYDVDTGYISDSAVGTKQQQLQALGSIAASQFLMGQSIVAANFDSLDLTVRYDYLTGEEFIIDRTTGAIFTNSGTPDAALLTWKVDQRVLPQKFRIERTEIQGGEFETFDELDSTGQVVSTEIARDQDGVPVISVPELDEVTVNFGFGVAANFNGSPADQVAYLDNTAEAGKTYWYRVVAVYGNGVSATLPDLTPSSEVVKKVLDLIRSILSATRGEGYSDFKGCYIPTDSDGELVRTFALQAATSDPPEWWMDKFSSQAKWEVVGIADIFEPIILAVEELRNFVEALLAAIAGIVDAVVAFIELLQTKLTTLNTFIELLQAIIALLQVFEALSFSCLFVTTTEGNSGVLQAVNDSAALNSPTTGPSDYVGAITILGGTAGVGAALNAVKLLFGLS